MLRTLEKKLNYAFKDISLLETAVTHSSFSKNLKVPVEFNERLEFLGDAFLDAIVGEELFRCFPDEEEGFLSRVRATLVCEMSLAREAQRLDLGSYIRLGKGEEKTGGRARPSILADAMEAIIGAVFLDGGFDEAKRVVLTLFHEALESTKKGRLLITDYKTALQEWLQGQGITDIKYVLADEKGPDHCKIFFTELHVQGKKVSEGSGKSKKQAEQNSAELALRSYDVI